jgi:uncharacterized membrane protein
VADGWGDRIKVGALIGGLAAISAVAVWGIGTLSRRKAARAEGVVTSLATAQAIALFATTMICGLMAALTFGWIGAEQSPARLTMGFLCLLFAGVGAYLGKVGPNPLVGVRTPWTFSSRLAWDKSNRLAGRLFLWGGLIGAIATPFVPQPDGLRATILGVLAIAVVTVFEGWRVWRGDPERLSAM